MVPANVRFESAHRAGFGGDDRLEPQEQLLLAQRRAEVLFEPAAEDRLVLEFAREEPVLPSPAVLRGIKRKVSGTLDLVAAHPVVGHDGDADRGTDHAAPVLETVGLAQHGNDLGGELAQNTAVVDIR